MRTIFALALALVLTGSAYAQETVVICAPVYAKWGSNRLEVMQACGKAKLTLYETTAESEQGISQVTYLDGAVARIFTLLYGKYVSFTLLNLDQSAQNRSKFYTKQIEEFILLTSDEMQDGKWIVTCADYTLKVGLEAAKDKVTLTINNQSTLEEIAKSRR